MWQQSLNIIHTIRLTISWAKNSFIFKMNHNLLIVLSRYYQSKNSLSSPLNLILAYICICALIFPLSNSICIITFERHFSNALKDFKNNKLNYIIFLCFPSWSVRLKSVLPVDLVF